MAASSYARLLYGVALLVLVFSSTGHGSRTKDKIYIGLQTQNACFRTLNGTHQFGCSSNTNGNVGVLIYLEGENEREEILEKGPHAPYIVLLEAKDFNKPLVMEMVNSKRVVGILVNNVVNETEGLPVTQFSADKSCPNVWSGMYQNDSRLGSCEAQRWNPVGDGFHFEDIGIPIFSVTVQSDIDTLLQQCYEKFNKPINEVRRNYPLCAVELQDRMAAVQNSVTCIRRSEFLISLEPVRVCDPMGDKNVIGMVKVVPKGTQRLDRSVIVAATRMDSFSMFNNEHYSSDTTASGIIALLAAAEVIGKVKDRIQSDANSKDILFTFFQGEAFDYIGSSRMIYDMEQNLVPSDAGNNLNQQPLRLSHIHSFLELSQVGLRDQDSLWLHTDPVTRSKHSALVPEIEHMTSVLTKEGEANGVQLRSANASRPLPPASVHRFLQKTAFPAVVVTDHENAFTNKFYNSRWDLPDTINASYPAGLNESEKYDYVTSQAASLTNVSTTLARALYKLATGNTLEPNITASSATVAHLLYCFLHSPHCDLFNSSIDPQDAKSLSDAKQPFPFYVSVHYLTNQITALTQRILAQYLGDRVEMTEAECEASNDKDKTYSYLWMQGPVKAGSPTLEREGRCYKATVYYSVAKSPAFDISGYDMQSGEYSTFTESVWKSMTARVFLVSSQQWQTVTLSVGMVVLICSLTGVYLISYKANVLFASRSPEYL